MSMLAELVEVVIGVDTHTDTHTAAVVTAATGAVLAVRTVLADPAGYAELIALADEHGEMRAWAVEGTGGYGAGLARHLAEPGSWSSNSTARPGRRGAAGPSPTRSTPNAPPGTRCRGPGWLSRRPGRSAAALQMLLTVRRAAVEAAVVAQRQLHALVVTAPEPVRARFRGQPTRTMLATAARLRLHGTTSSVRTAITALRALARRVPPCRPKPPDTSARSERSCEPGAPTCSTRPGIGPIDAAVVLTAWSHPGRCRSDAAFAMLAGAAPIPASSGKTVRHRLNRSGDRQLNRALHNIALCRMRYDPATRAYADRRRADGKTDREIRRCLKRYIARQLYRQLEAALPSSLTNHRSVP